MLSIGKKKKFIYLANLNLNYFFFLFLSNELRRKMSNTETYGDFRVEFLHDEKVEEL